MPTIQEQFFDIGANLTHKSFDDDLEKVMDEAAEAGVTKISITGSSLEESIRAAEIAGQFSESCISTAGIHPHNAKEYDKALFSEIESLLNLDQVGAIGETGLDFYRNFSSPEQQQKSFEAHLELAIQTGKPLFLHERESHEKFVEITTSYLKFLPKSIVHCFTGNKEALIKYIDMGFYIGITGWLCDERRGKHLEELVDLIPLDKLMIETDAPYLLPRDMGIDNSSRNEPRYLAHIANKLSSFRSESKELLFSAMYMNSLDFFDL